MPLPGDLPAAIRIAPADDVAVALRDIQAGEEIRCDGATLTSAEPIARGHKLALHAIARASTVRKYGFPIGEALADIAAGEHLHSHNLRTTLGGEETYRYVATAAAPQPALTENPTFEGYLRADGRVGTRNEIWILPTVGCVARTAQKIAAEAHARFAGQGVDGVYAFTHPFGCSQLGEDHAATRAILAALARHPNAGGVLFAGLGCENNQLGPLLAEAGLNSARVASFAAQASEDEQAEGLAAVEQLVEVARHDRRTQRTAADLVIGLKCGGSDGLSGVTANPLLGAVTDAITAVGGSAILTEIPEVFGAERLLMARATDEAVFDRAVRVVEDFKRYFTDHGQPIYENPSPGNKAGGITTLEEKSLGAVQKAGSAPLRQVLRYGEGLDTTGSRRGLALLEAPGNDAVSSTALAAAGATVILFTTGRGTPLGFPAPTLKIATNTELAARKPGWIDFDAQAVLTQGMARTRDDLLALITATASGAPTRAETNGEREIALWKRGVTL